MKRAKTRFLLAFDFGTGAGRCLLIDIAGTRSVAARREWAFEAPPEAQPGGFAFDASHFWTVLGKAAREAMAQGHVDGSQIAAVSATGMREGFVLLNDSGTEIFAVPNRDRRAGAEAAEVGERLGEAMYRRSGHWPSPIMLPARFLWLRRRCPHVAARARSLLMISDWILYRLCGEQVCERTNAAETCLFDVAACRWDEELIRASEIPVEIFPRVVEAGQRIGSVTPLAAETTGLLPGTPVVAGGADTESALLGMGLVEPGEVGVVAGTSTPVQVVLDAPRMDPQQRTWTSPHVVPGRWVLEGNAGVTGSVLRWFRDSFCQQEKSAADKLGLDPFHVLEQMAGRSPIGAAGVIALMGPRIMNARRGALRPVGAHGFAVANVRDTIADCEGKPHFLRAILESFAFAVRGNLEQLQELCGHPLGCIRVCGGSSTSDLWMQMVSDLLGRAIERSVPGEASGVGAAVCAGLGVGAYADVARGIRALVRVGTRFEPQADRWPQYDTAYHRWLALQRADALA